MQCFIFPSKSVGIAFEAAIKRQFISSDMSHLSFSLNTGAQLDLCCRRREQRRCCWRLLGSRKAE